MSSQSNVFVMKSHSSQKSFTAMRCCYADATKCRLGKMSSWQNVVAPFSRRYLCDDGVELLERRHRRNLVRTFSDLVQGQVLEVEPGFRSVADAA